MELSMSANLGAFVNCVVASLHNKLAAQAG